MPQTSLRLTTRARNVAMSDPASERLQRRLNRIAWVAVLVLVAAGGLALALSRSSGDYARRRVRDEVAEIKAGQRERIYVSNQVEMTEFAAAARQLDDSHPFDLSIEYASKVDDFLRQIAGQHGLRGLVLNLTDVSDAGIDSVAALPDLERLTINYIGEGLGSSGGWLRYLPPQTLVETLEPLEKSAKLTKLELYTRDVPAEEIRELRGRLPNCTITLPLEDKQRRGASRK